MVLISFLLPLFSSAAGPVQITEIMYDPVGSDTDREWIEIYNPTAFSLDLTGWKLFENDTNHSLSFPLGSSVLPPTSYAVIADDAEQFGLEYPEVGMVIDSVFGLNNTGEPLVLRDNSLADIDAVAYSVDSGSPTSGTGASLQRQSDGSWIAALATPGAANSTVVYEIPSEPTDPKERPDYTDIPTIESYGRNDALFTNDTLLYVYAGENRRVAVGTEVEFVGAVKDGDKHEITYARYYWNFGDGSTSKRRAATHTFTEAGQYVVTLSVDVNGLSGEDKVLIEVVEPKLAISLVDETAIEITNQSQYEFDVGGFVVRTGEREFVFPPHTTLLHGGTIRLKYEVTGLLETPLTVIIGPNGEVVATTEPAAAAAEAKHTEVAAKAAVVTLPLVQTTPTTVKVGKVVSAPAAPLMEVEESTSEIIEGESQDLLKQAASLGSLGLVTEEKPAGQRALTLIGVLVCLLALASYGIVLLKREGGLQNDETVL